MSDGAVYLWGNGMHIPIVAPLHKRVANAICTNAGTAVLLASPTDTLPCLELPQVSRASAEKRELLRHGNVALEWAIARRAPSFGPPPVPYEQCTTPLAYTAWR
jgi:hypothetical protein